MIFVWFDVYHEYRLVISTPIIKGLKREKRYKILFINIRKTYYIVKTLP